MAEILLVNPRRRKKGRRMSALQRKYFGRKRGRKTSSRRRRRRAPVAVATPRRRRRRRVTSSRRKRNVYLNPRRRSRRSRRALTRSFRRRRTNPSLRGITGSIMPTVKAGLIGATGALGLDLAWGYGKAYLPAQIAASPFAQYATKLLGAIFIGVLGNKLPFLRGKGRDLAVGASTVVLHDALKTQLESAFPNLQFGEYLTYAPTVGVMPRAGRLLSTGIAGVGEYLSGIPDQADDGTYSGDWNGDGINGY
jgi:hypothetical protein